VIRPSCVFVFCGFFLFLYPRRRKLNWFFLVQFSLVGNSEIPSEKNWQGGRWRHCCCDLIIELLNHESKMDSSSFGAWKECGDEGWEGKGGMWEKNCLGEVGCWGVEKGGCCGEGRRESREGRRGRVDVWGWGGRLVGWADG
jgi:hypothetical protein